MPIKTECFFIICLKGRVVNWHLDYIAWVLLLIAFGGKIKTSRPAAAHSQEPCT